MSDQPPEEKQLETTSFVIHATRGVIRDRSTRRRVMLLTVALAVVFVVSGFTFLQSILDPKEHPWLVVAFWLVCIWLTLTAILLAVYELITLRLEERRAERELREQLNRSTSTRSTSNE